MNVSVQEAGPCRKRLSIAIPAEKVHHTYADVLTAYTKGAKLPGFRPGKAPKELVNRRYSSKIAQEVKERLIPQGYREAMEQENIKPVAIIGVENVSYKIGESLEFQVTLDVSPDFILPDYKNLSLKKNTIEITEEDINTTIQRILNSRSVFEDVEKKAVESGDMVLIDYEGFAEGKAIEAIVPQAKELAQANDFWIQTEAESFIPGLPQALLGLSPNERKQVLIDFPKDFSEDILAGKKAEYFITVKAIREKKAPVLDKEFLKSIQVESEEALRENIKKDLCDVKGNQEKERLKSEIVKILLLKTEMELPSSVVDYETKNTVYNLVKENSSRGVSQEEIEDKKSEILESAGQNAEDKIKIHYIIHRIAELESIEVSEDEFAGRVQAMAQHYQLAANEMKSLLEKKNLVNNIKDDLLLHKTLEVLLDDAEIIETD